MSNIKHAFIDLSDPAIFQGFGGEAYWEKLEVPAGTVVVGEGGETTDFYYVLSGNLKVTKSLKDAENTQADLATLVGGDFFGEGALLSDKLRSASVSATADSVLLKLSQKKFEELLLADAQAAMGITLGIVKVLNLRLQSTNERLVVLYNVLRTVKTTSDAGVAIPSVLMDLGKVMHHDVFVLFGNDGLPRFNSEGLSEDEIMNFQMKIPDYANRLAAAGAPAYFVDEGMAFFSLKNSQGVTGVLAAKICEACQVQDLPLLMTVAEQVGHLIV